MGNAARGQGLEGEVTPPRFETLRLGMHRHAPPLLRAVGCVRLGNATRAI